jgi:hypothetical protein
MKANMSTLDRGIRIALAVFILILKFTGVLSGTTAIVLLIMAAVFALVSTVNFCPIYGILGWSTKK